MKQYFLVDENGFPDYETSKVFGDKVEDGYILGWTTPFYKPRWDGEAWVEGATPEEIEEILKPEPQEPTEVELLQGQIDMQQQVINDLLFSIIPNLGEIL